MSPPKRHDLKTMINICYMIGLTPYAWNSDKLRLELTTKKWKIFHWKANIGLYILYVIFLLARSIQISLEPDGVTTRAQMQTFISVSLIGLAFFQEFWKSWETGHFLINRIIHLDKKCENEFMEWVGSGNNLATGYWANIANISKSSSRRQKIILALGSLAIILYTIRMNFLPERANHLTSLLPNPKMLTILEKLPFLAIHCYIWMLVYFGILLPYSIALFFWKTIEENLCNMFEQSRRRTFPINEVLRVYTPLRVLQLEYNDVWGNFLNYFLFLCVSCEILNVYQAVVLHTIRAIFIAGMITYTMYTLVQTAADPYNMSVVILNSCGSGSGSLWFRKYVKSCRPLFTNNGGYGFFDKPLLLTLWNIVIVNTATLIVSHQHERS